MSKSKCDLRSMITSVLDAENAEAKQLAARWKQKVVPAILVTCIDNELHFKAATLRRSGGSWQHDLDDALDELYPRKPRRVKTRRK